MKAGNPRRSLRIHLIALLLSAMAIFAVGQTAPSHLEFEVASIRSSPPRDANTKIGLHIDGAQVRLNSASIRDCMLTAWKIRDYQVIGPEWIASDRFDIAAKLPDGARPDDVPEMLRNLLIDRFKIRFHKEQKEFPVYALVAAKDGLKLKETPPDSIGDASPNTNLNVNVSTAGVFVDLGQGTYYSLADNKLTIHKMSMVRLAETLTLYMDKPVVDMTGVPAAANFDGIFAVTPDDYRTMGIRSAIRAGVSLPPQVLQLADASTDSLDAAMELDGLRLESRKAPLDVIVIDQGAKTPAGN